MNLSDLPIHIDEYRLASSPSTLPDPTLPLLNRDNPAEFVKSLDARRQLGRVYSQCRNLGNASNHPTVFYVEFPAESGSFFELDASRLVRTLGNASGHGPFTRREVARFIDAIPTEFNLSQFLHACRPQ